MSKKQVKLVFRIVLFTATAISLFFVPWPIVWAWIMPLPGTVQEQVEDSIGYGFDGVIVYVDRAGEPPAFYSAGWHDRVKKIPADPHALFKIASITKLYDAVAITKLVSDEQLSLDKTLADYFPELKGRIEYADQITLRLMVQHRSGIPNFTDVPSFYQDPPGSAEEALGLVLDQPASFKPGEGYQYSNTNYLLIGQLIEKVTGVGKYEYIGEVILDPLGLENTFGSIHDVDMDKLMSGYYVGLEKDFKTDDEGLIIATAEDTGIFLRALNDGSVFEEGEQDIYSSIYVYDHTGLMPGYQSIAKYHADIDTVVIQFTNTTDFLGYNWNLSQVAYGRVVKILRKEARD